MTKWISIAKQLPAREGDYLCAIKYHGHRFYSVKYFNIEKREFSTTDNITHWKEIEKVNENGI